MTTTIIALALVTWLVTNIVVDSEIFRPLRAWITDKKYVAQHGERPQPITMQNMSEALRRMWNGVLNGPVHPRSYAAWSKLNSLVTCKLCAGTWIALAAVTVQPDARPLGTGVAGWLLAGLLVKAVAHLTLEVVAVLQEYARPV